VKSESGAFGSWQFLVVANTLVGKVTSALDGTLQTLAKLVRVDAWKGQPESSATHAYFSDGEYFVHISISDRGTGKVLARVDKHAPGEKGKSEIAHGPCIILAAPTAVPIGPTPTRGERSASLSAAQHADKQVIPSLLITLIQL